MGELASKLVDELLLVASAFSEFKSVEPSNSESFSQLTREFEGDNLDVSISESWRCYSYALQVSSYNLLPVYISYGGLKLARGTTFGC